MEFGILGPLEVRADGRVVGLGGARPRAVLAVLALHANRPVSGERLAVALWGEDVPPGAVKTVQVYVARLRKALADADVLVTTPAGYVLRVGPGELDAERFERRVADGRQALAAGRGDYAAAELRAALELWRGPPLADLASAPFAPTEIARLEEQRLAAVEVRVDADLAAGRHAELVGELQQLTTQQPWRERLHAQLMLALYRSGRQADALEAYRHARDVLVDQLGLEPGSELHDLHQAILDHDPSLAAPAPPATPPSGAHDGGPTGMGALGDRLPAPPNRTVGRRRELDAVGERLRASSVRLLTLTGPGGVGKTRLALEAAHTVQREFPDGARFITLATLQRAEEVPAAIVRALGIVVLEGESAEQAVGRFLAGKQMLLAVDNCEHVLAAAPFIGGMLRSCPGVTVLATSREPLALQAEEIQPVPPLALRDDAGSEATSPDGDAVELFAERARAHDPTFELSGRDAAAVAEICRRVDGLPLAIELAAARCGLLSPAEIAQRLHTALGAPGAGARDAPARQQTLRATIDWSHDLLSEDERACFARCAVFAGGATVEAAEAITVAGLETLDRLVAKSLLVRRGSPDGRTRLTMLETVRAYAGERLGAAPDVGAIHARHYQYFLALAQHHGSERALFGTSANQHLARLDPEIENLHAALGWAVSQRDAESALALCATLGWYWLMRDRYAEALGWIDRALSLPGADTHRALRVRVLCIRGGTLWPLGRKREQPAVAQQAEAIARTLADPILLCEALYTRARYEGPAGRPDLAGTLADEALHLAREAGDDWAAGMAASARTIAAHSAAELRERVDLAAALLEGVGNVYELAWLLANASYTALRMGSDSDASDFVRRATPVTRELDSPYLWMFLRGNAGLTALLTGNADAARDAFEDELRLSRALVTPPFMSEGVGGLAAVAAARGDLNRAARLSGAADAHGFGQQDDAVDARLLETYFQPARSRHGPDAWDAASREGAAMSFDDAIAYALNEPNG